MYHTKVVRVSDHFVARHRCKCGGHMAGRNIAKLALFSTSGKFAKLGLQGLGKRQISVAADSAEGDSYRPNVIREVQKEIVSSASQKREMLQN